MLSKKSQRNQLISNIGIIVLIIYIVIAAVDTIIAVNTEGMVAGIKAVIILMIQLSTLITYLYLVDKPIISLLIILMSQVINFTYNLVDLKNISEAINESAFTILLVTLIILININLGLNKVDKNLKLKEKLNTIINTTRSTLKVKWWAKLIIYSTIVTVVMTVSRSDILSTISNDNGVRLYGALAVVMPTIIIISLLTTSELAYEILGFKLVVELYTLYNLYVINSIDIKDVAYWAVQLCILIWSIYNLKIDREKQSKDKNSREQTKEQEKVNIE